MGQNPYLSALTEKYPFRIDQLRIILESIPANVFFKDTQGRYQLASHLCDMLNTGGAGTIVGKTDLEIQPDAALGQKFYQEDMDIVRTGRKMQYIQEMVFGPDTYYYSISKEPVRDENGKLMGIIGIVEDMTEIITLQKQLEAFCYMDRMTGAQNRDYYEKLLEAPPDFRPPLAVVVADCNGLKEVNDRFGHDTGDYLILSTVSNIRRYMTGDSTLIRLGGDEFLVLLPACPEEACRTFLDNVRESEREVRINGTPLSTSFGYAILREGETLSDAVERADRRMYADKRRSKGC